MIPALIPPDDAQRVEALLRCDVLDTAPDPAFDRITRLLALLLDVPGTFVSLIDADRQWLKSKVGVGISEQPRGLAFCGYTILADECLVVEDTRADARLSGHPMVVAEPGLRFYAGMPLTSPDGFRVGTLCAVDNRPRRLDERGRRILRLMAGIAADQLELHRTSRGLHRELRERVRLERCKDELVATVSHELRTPLTAISGSLALVQQGAGGALPEQAARLLDVASRGSQRLLAIVNDILEVERLGSAQTASKRELVLLGRLAASAIDAARPLAQRFGVDLRLLQPDEDAPVLCDPGRILRVLDNLICNAIKHSPADGVIDVAVERDTGGVTVSVRDRGLGIPQDFQPRVFERFAMADGSGRRLPSSGLGLSIARAIVEEHGGRIGFASPLPDGGTRFWFSLAKPSGQRH